jgi:hypothetical protein
MIDYTQILSVNYIGSQWTLNGDYYEGLDWRDESPKPTQAQLDVLWESTQSILAAKKQAIIDTKASALAKLSALGLTENEIIAILGTTA